MVSATMKGPKAPVIGPDTTPAQSVLETLEQAMVVCCAESNAARRRGDKVAEAYWLGRLGWWTAQATGRLQEVA